MLRIEILGPLEVKRDGQPVPLPPSKKSRALLGYLAASARKHSRERLCEMFFEGPDDPRAALRWSLTRLREVVGGHLVCSREQVELQTQGATLDLLEIRPPATATTDALAHTATLFRGELLEGLDLPNCFRYEQWCAGERERLRQVQAAVLRELVRRLGTSEAALVHAQRRVAVDPFDDGAHAELVRLLAALGQGQEALRQYDRSRALFARELGGHPLTELEEARRTIGKTAPPAVARPEAPAIRKAMRPLVGRARELAEIASARGVVLVLGEPGIGKSRLLEELLARAAGPAAHGRAFAAEMVRPFGIWIDLLSTLGHDLPRESDRGRLFDAVLEIVSPLELVLLDDVQWIDEASAALLHYLVRRQARPTFVLAARQGEVEDNPHASRLLTDLARAFRPTRIDLGPLAAEETRVLLAASPDAEHLAEASRGNPLYALELARAGAGARGEALFAIIALRLSQLDPAAAELVPWAAALGRQFDVEILGRATAQPAGEMLSALDKLERHAILCAAGERSYDFTHDLVREAAYRMISAPRRTLIHGHIARALGSTHDPAGALAGEILHHASLARDHGMAARAAVAAGERCLRLFAYAEAMGVARRGLHLASTLRDEERVVVQMELMQVLVMSRTPIPERLGFAGAIGELSEEARRLSLAKSAALGAHLLACLHMESNDYRGAMSSTVRSAELGRQADPATAALAMAATAHCLVFLQQDIGRAGALLAEAQALGAENVELALGLGYLHAHQGRSALAQEHLERALALARRSQNHWREWLALTRLVMLALEDRDAPRALRSCEGLRAVAVQMAGGSEDAQAAVLEALARQAAGEDVDLEGALAGLRAADCKGALAWALGYLAEIEVEQGAGETARVHAREARAAAEEMGRESEAVIAGAILGVKTKVKNRRDLSMRAQRYLKKEGRHGHARAGAGVRTTDHA